MLGEKKEQSNGTTTVTAKQKYLALIQQKKEKGLKDVKFFAGNTFDVSEERAYEELIRLHEASDLPDPEVLGKYSPVAKKA